MKKLTFFLILLLINHLSCNSQETINKSGLVTNEAIQQIQTLGSDDIMNFQALNQGFSNYALIHQTGNQNNTSISQQSYAGSSMNNKSYTVQTGTTNELTVGQVGTGNLLLGIQIGGEGNKINISQNGINNGISAVQLGSYNTITAEQKGQNNYLSALQNGTNNSVTNYKQENESEQVLFDRIIQIGDNLSITTDGVANSTPAVNKFTQTGTNLSFQLSTSLLCTGTGVEINQIGHDMKVVVDQSYFSFPLGKP